ncbi:MAG TPA: AmiS/UreI family transporter [Actinomycetospora sp.]|nr:AmiS/UreI family transporter [Actinomycetospora sp.]
MAAVGLFYVGAVLFVNGLMLLGLVEPRSAAIINLFVGSLQVITPTYLIFTANGDTDQILLASGLYLFGFTYLYVGINLLAGLDSTGVGYFSLFVAIAAIGFSYANFTVLADPPFGVIWLYWAVLWTLFFLLLGLKRDFLTRYTGYVTTIQGWVTAAIPGFLLLIGAWPTTGITAIVLGAFGVAMLLVLLPTLRTPRRRHEAGAASGPGPKTVPDSELSRT